MMTEQAEYTYDLFISYAEADRAWVEGYLFDALTQADVRYTSEAAFELGKPRLLEFEQAVQQSQRTLLVLSTAYLAESFSQFTDLLAQSYGLETATWPVIPLILHPVKLPPRLAMLTRLEAADLAQWPMAIERLCAELQRPVPGPAPRPLCPYPGMVPFSEADHNRFFGRDEEVPDLLESLRLHPFLTVIGPSGSGKSSLVFAGLVPALRKSGLFSPGEWLVRPLRPGEAPLDALADALNGDPADPARAVSELLSTQPNARRLLLVVDQFEELFTLARSDDVEPFQQALLRLTETSDCYVVLTVRADFYPDLMASPLWGEIEAHRAEVLPLDKDGLSQAIVRPAEAEDVGVYIETALVERLVEDAAGEPGILPMLQETLVLLWERLERRFLPLSAYEALGDAKRTGLQVAMARRADNALKSLKKPGQEKIARRIFLRLVQFGEGRADTRRQQPLAALRAAGDEPLFEQTLHHLADRDNRLLTLSGEERDPDRQVDIAHEALIGAWPKLQEWLDERRDAERVRRRLVNDVEEWKVKNRDGSFLYEGTRLEQAQAWAAENESELNKDLREFLAASGRREVRRQRVQWFVRAVIVLFALFGIVFFGQFVRVNILRIRAQGPMESFRTSSALLGTDDDAGTDDNPNPAYPQREVEVPAFSIDRYQVTNEQYAACVDAGACTPPQGPLDYRDEALARFPVVYVDPRQAATFCHWIGRRLPTQTEWERAARGTDGRPWPWGGRDAPPTSAHVNLKLAITSTIVSEPEGRVPVDDPAFAAGRTPEGLTHMLGNVWEWTSTPTSCQSHYECSEAEIWDGQSTDVNALYIRGLAWYNTLDINDLDRITEAKPADFFHSDDDIGFRCADF